MQFRCLVQCGSGPGLELSHVAKVVFQKEHFPLFLAHSCVLCVHIVLGTKECVPVIAAMLTSLSNL